MFLTRKPEIDPALLDANRLLELMNKEQTKEDLDFILGRLEELSFFNNFVQEQFRGTQRKDVLGFCSRLKMEHFKGGDLIFMEQEASNDKMYIIFYGSVLLMRQKKMDQLQQHSDRQIASPVPEKHDYKFTQLINAKKFSNKLMKVHKEKLISPFEKLLLQERYGDQFKIMKKGEGLGDKALRENVPRSLTAAAYSQDLFMVVLLKNDFMQFSQQFEKQIKKKQRLVFGVFKNVNNEYSTARLETMIYSCQTIQYEKGYLLALEGEIGENFYIIQKGDVTLSKKDVRKETQLCIVSKGHLLGEEIVINTTGRYEYTAIVSSINAKVMVIQASQFATKFPDECRKQIIQDYKTKQSNRRLIFKKLHEEHKSIRAQSQSDIMKLGKIDFIEHDFKKNDQFGELIESKISDIKLNKNFLKQYQNNTVHSFCIRSIVETEVRISKTIQSEESHNGQVMNEFDFGSMSNEQQKRRQHLFESKMNVKKPYQNFLKPNLKVLPLAIKSDLLKTLRRSPKVHFIQLDRLGMTTQSYSVTTSHRNIRQKNQLMIESENSDSESDAEQVLQPKQVFPEFVTLEENQLKGLDIKLLEIKEQKIDAKSQIQKIKESLSNLKSVQIKKTTDPLALKVDAFLKQPKQMTSFQMDHIYLYDADPLFGSNMPSFIVRSRTQEQKAIDEIYITPVQDDATIELLSQAIIATNNLTTKRVGDTNNTQIAQLQVDSDDDIFADAKQSIPHFQSLTIEIEPEKELDLNSYVNTVLDDKYYAQLESQMKMEEEQKKAKQDKHRKMLEDMEDHYMECYQPVNLSIEDEKKRKDEVEKLKLLNPEFKDLDFIKKDKLKKKKKRENLNKQLDEIEDLIIKKQK